MKNYRRRVLDYSILNQRESRRQFIHLPSCSAKSSSLQNRLASKESNIPCKQILMTVLKSQNQNLDQSFLEVLPNPIMGTMEAMYPAYPIIPPRPPKTFISWLLKRKKIFRNICNNKTCYFYVAMVATIIPKTEINTFSVVKEGDTMYNLSKKTILVKNPLSTF